MGRANFLRLLTCFSIYFSIENVESLEVEGIVGGEVARTGEYGYTVTLFFEDEYKCGGSLLDNNHVITAAHCVHDGVDFFNIPITVVGGIDRLQSPASTRRELAVKKVYVLAAFTGFPKYIDDIAILQLDGTFDVDNYSISTLNLPEHNGTKSYAGQKAIVTGFGMDHMDVTVDPSTGKIIERGYRTGKMRFAYVDVIENSYCQDVYDEDIFDTQLCARVVQRKAENPEGICTGDSGAPLVHNNNTIIGVVSFNDDGCVENVSPAVYTNIASYKDFIAKARGDINSPEIVTTELERDVTEEAQYSTQV